MSKKTFVRFFWVVAIILSTRGIIYAMPYHPTVLEKIKNGEIKLPTGAPSIAELKARGIDNPLVWAKAKADFAKTGKLSAAPKGIKGPSGDFKALVILLDFSDNIASVNPAEFDTLVFDTLTGVNHYYRKVSYGNIDIITVNYPSSTGWLRAPQTYAYYVDSLYGFGSYPQNAQKMVEDAVVLVDAAGVDFSQYDNDGDSYVDALFVVHAGQGREYTGSVNDIHSHAWTTSYAVPLDGVYVYNYSTEPEYWATPGDMTIGVYSHELGHALFDLPDMYDYDYDSEGLGDWSLMAGGSWNGPLGSSPAFPDAYCHYKMGYVTPTNVLSNIMGQPIKAVEDTAQIFRLWTYGATSVQYFLVENRQKTGYDSYLPGGGLHVYHVDESVSDNGANDNQWYPGYTAYGHYKVAMEQADGLWELEQNSVADAADPYPGTTAKVTFDSSTTPNSRDYNAVDTKVQVRNISSSAAIMTADLYVSDGMEPIMNTDHSSFSVNVPQNDSLDETLAVSNSGGSNLNWYLTYLNSAAVNYDNADYGNSIGVGGGTFMVAARFTSTELTSYYNTYELYAVKAYIAEAVTNLTVKVWQGGTSSPTTEIYSENVTSSTVTGWNTYQLSAPIIMQASNTYWVGYSVTGGTWPAAADNGPAIDTKGDWIYLGSWTELQLYGYDWNWNIRGMLGKKLADWITIDPTSGTVTPAGTNDVTFKFNATSMAEGAYSDTVCLGSNDPVNNPKKIPVNMTVGSSGVAGEPIPGLPSFFALQNAYPNPARGQVNFKYQLPKAAKVGLNIYNVLGQTVKSFDRGVQQPGYYSVKWSDANVAEGVYFIRLQAGNYQATKKFVVVR